MSNLASMREAKVEPKLAFTFNGSKFDSAAATTPFAESRKTDAQIQFKGLDLVPYLGYVPSGLPVQLKAGSLDADIKIDFERAATAGLKISGTVATHGIRVADGEGRDLLAFDSLTVGLADIRPLERMVHLGEIGLVAPNLAVARDAAGKLNLLPKNPATGAAEKPGPKSDADEAADRNQGPGAAPWKIEVDKFALSDGNIGWHDETVKPAAVVEMTGLGVQVTGIQWPMEKPANFSGGFSGGAAAQVRGAGHRQGGHGQGTSRGLASVAGGAVPGAKPGTHARRRARRRSRDRWAQPDLKFKASKVSIDGLALSQGKTALASVGRFELTDAVADMTQHTLAIGTFSANQPKVRVERDKDEALDVRAVAQGAVRQRAVRGSRPRLPHPSRPMPDRRRRTRTRNLGADRQSAGRWRRGVLCRRCRQQPVAFRSPRSRSTRRSWRPIPPRRLRWKCPAVSLPGARTRASSSTRGRWC